MTTIQTQTPPSSMNCWSLSSSPPAHHQMAAQHTSPNQSPSHQVYSPITSITNLSYPGYYTDVAYQSPEYVPVVNSELTYTQIGLDRSTPIVYQSEEPSSQKDEYEGSTSIDSTSEERPGSAPSTSRHEWISMGHIQH